LFDFPGIPLSYVQKKADRDVLQRLLTAVFAGIQDGQEFHPAVRDDSAYGEIMSSFIDELEVNFANRVDAVIVVMNLEEWYEKKLDGEESNFAVGLYSICFAARQGIDLRAVMCVLCFTACHARSCL
jgi:hypothetical protein